MSLLSDEILAFYKADTEQNIENIRRFFDTKRGYNFKEICNYLQIDNECFELLQYNDFLELYEKLLPIFIYTHKIFQQSSGKNFCVGWLVFDENEKQLFFSRELKNDVELIEQILLLTSLMDNGLRNIYCMGTARTNISHLLKDLLATQKIEDTFGKEAVLFMRILLGTPKSINLRNIVWHGFPKPNEIPEYYRGVLVMLIHSLGIILREQDLTVHQRNGPHEFPDYFFENKLIKPEKVLLKGLEKNLWEGSILPSDFHEFWVILKEKYKSREFVFFNILILPQIELILRFYYAKANGFDTSAKLDEYYITMDSVFEHQIPGEENKPNLLLTFKQGITEGCFKYMYDLFVDSIGPTFRNNISHGEYALKSLDSHKLSIALLHLSLELLNKEKGAYIPKDFEGEYHTNIMTYNRLRELISTAANFRQKYLNSSREPMISIRNIKVKIFIRPKYESKFINLIDSIAESLAHSLDNFDSSITLKQQKLEDGKLHFRSRRTLAKMLEILPTLEKLTYEIFQLISALFFSLQDDEPFLEDEALSSDHYKFFKKLLKFVENLESYSLNNKWMESVELYKKFQDAKKNFLENIKK